MKAKGNQVKVVVRYGFILAVLLLIPVVVVLTTTYRYGTDVLTRDEIQMRAAVNQPLHCVQTSSFLGIANGYECFDSREAADAFMVMATN